MSLRISCAVLYLFLRSIWIGSPVVSGDSVSAKDYAEAMNYFGRLGYLPERDPRAGRLLHLSEVTEAIKRFQEFAGLPMTGKVDQDTMDMVKMPRCGMPDIGRSDSTRRRRRRYAVQGSTWKKRDLTYHFQGGPRSGITMQDVREQTTRAFKEWERVTNLRFSDTTSPNADILVRFRRGMHEDAYPFDGVGGTLAHGFYPHNNLGLSGDVHFDDDENWVLTRTQSGTDFYWTALHEIGHSLGLDHSSNREAVMYPFYTGFKESLRLNEDDIQGIRYLYGMPDVKIQTQAPPTKVVTLKTRTNYPSGMPNPCDTSVDAVFTDADNVAYFFTGKYFWTVLEAERNGPFLINDKWKRLPSDGIDAAYRSNNHTTFFKGRNCWIYNGTEYWKGPIPISQQFKLNSSVDSIDAAFVWAPNGKTYLFKNDLYWRYNEASNTVDMGYPVNISKAWKGIPNNLDSAMTWINGKTYFFKGSSFWIFNNFHIQATDLKPMKINMYWMKCSSFEAPSGGTILGMSSSLVFVFSTLTALSSVLIYMDNLF